MSGRWGQQRKREDVVEKNTKNNNVQWWVTTVPNAFLILTSFNRWGNWGPRLHGWFVAEQQAMCLQNPRLNSCHMQGKSSIRNRSCSSSEDKKERLDEAGASILLGWRKFRLQPSMGSSLDLHKTSGILWIPQHKENASDILYLKPQRCCIG